MTAVRAVKIRAACSHRRQPIMARMVSPGLRVQIKGTTSCLQVTICGHSGLHKQPRPGRASLPLLPLFFLFISLSLFWLVWDRFVLSNEEGSRCEKVPVFLRPTGIGPHHKRFLFCSRNNALASHPSTGPRHFTWKNVPRIPLPGSG